MVVENQLKAMRVANVIVDSSMQRKSYVNMVELKKMASLIDMTTVTV